jgi:magnesium transporter
VPLAAADGGARAVVTRPVESAGRRETDMIDTQRNPAGKTGLPPGSLIHIGDDLQAATTVSMITLSATGVDEKKIQSIDGLLKYQQSESVTWLIVEGLRNTDLIAQIGAAFDVHQLVLEDILNTHQRPKFEEYNNYLYIVLKSIVSQAQGNFSVAYEQISLLLFDNVVVTFKEKADDLLEPVRQRILSSKGRLLTRGADYLAYMILDIIVDHCFILVDSLDEAVASLEDSLLVAEPTLETLYAIQMLKREILNIRRYISPIRELMAAMLRSESRLVDAKTRIYLRDVHDHAIRIIESIEVYREILSGLLEMYMTSINNKMNEVMKVLTVFASIFIPLTFLAGIYGMNFEYMPELRWKWAYPALWVVFLLIPAVLLVYFKRKKWL